MPVAFEEPGEYGAASEDRESLMLPGAHGTVLLGSLEPKAGPGCLRILHFAKNSKKAARQEGEV